jgi:hypothetical protein
VTCDGRRCTKRGPIGLNFASHDLDVVGFSGSELVSGAKKHRPREA